MAAPKILLNIHSKLIIIDTSTYKTLSIDGAYPYYMSSLIRWVLFAQDYEVWLLHAFYKGEEGGTQIPHDSPQYCKVCARAMVLNPWVTTLLGGQMTLSLGECIRSFGVGLLDCCEPPEVGAGNWTCYSRRAVYVLNHRSPPHSTLWVQFLKITTWNV